MIDREKRNKLARNLRRFALGCITNRELEAEMPDRTKDRTLSDIAGIIEFNYEDYCGPAYRLTDNGPLSRVARRQIARIILFLHTDIEHEHSPTPTSLRSVVHEAAATVGCLLYMAVLAIPMAIIVVPYMIHTRLLGVPLYRTAWRRLFPPKPEPEQDDIDIWPFENQSDYEHALSRPVFLAGKRTEGDRAES